MFVDYLPNPSDLKPLAALDENGKEIVRPTDVNEPFSAYVFKTVVDPYSGTINIIKVTTILFLMNFIIIISFQCHIWITNYRYK